MVYLSAFRFPNKEKEIDFRISLRETCHDIMYPFFVLSEHELDCLDFEPITILYGGNGSGKTTALNIIAEKIGARREASYNRSAFFERYTALCKSRFAQTPRESAIITSDDVFDFMLNIRTINEGVDMDRERLYDEYKSAKSRVLKVQSLDDYDELKKICDARSKTRSQFIRTYLKGNVRERSNGESAYMYFTDKIRDGGLYLLDEPENSLSPERQMDLVRFLEDSARFFKCQLIIATHSPFLLAMKGAKIYDLDAVPADVKKWTDIKNVRTYYEFFKKHEQEF